MSIDRVPTLAAFLFTVALVAAPAHADAPPPDDTPPEVAIKSPTDATALAAGTTEIAVEVTAKDEESGIYEVELKVDGKSVGTDDEAPFTFDKVALTPGEHTLVATARNYDAGSTESEAVKVTVAEPPAEEAKAEDAKAQDAKVEDAKVEDAKSEDAKSDGPPTASKEEPKADDKKKDEEKKGCNVSASQHGWSGAGIAFGVAILAGLMLRRRE